MHNPAAAQDNEAHKLLWDFDIQMDNLIFARSGLIITLKKRECTKVSTLLSLLTTE